MTAAAKTARSVRWWDGVLMGSLGVLAFSGTLPATRAAVPSFGPTIITYGRIEIAALLGALTLLFDWHGWPERRHLLGILWTGLGLAVGYPFFIALALESVPASHGAVVVGLAPAVTALVSVVRAGERPPLRFWVGCALGGAAVVAFAVSQASGGIQIADGWLLAAMLSVGIAYVEGARVSRELGGTATLCWAMLLLAPFAAIPFAVAVTRHPGGPIPQAAWVGFWYVGIISMFLGSVAWYRGLAAGGIARIGQLNLMQPLLTLIWSAFLLGERITWRIAATALVVLVSMTICIKSRVATATQQQRYLGGKDRLEAP